MSPKLPSSLPKNQAPSFSLLHEKTVPSQSLDKDYLRNIDAFIGNRLRLRRIMLGLTQVNLAMAVGLTFQQIQKYERGANRISASRLFCLSHILKVPFSYFFDAFEEGNSLNEEPTEVSSRRDVIELIRAYDQIDSSKVRRKLVDLVKILGVHAQNSDDVASE